VRTLIPKHRDGQRGIDEELLPFGGRGVVGVEVNRLGVHREQGHPDVVGVGDGATGTVLEGVADDEILVVQPGCLAVHPRRNLVVRRYWGFHVRLLH
jgi:hypothetical protein